MRVRILGCSGGIGLGLRTTSILVDDHILIDAGTGVGDLTIGELKLIQHVFLTHSHLDHVAGLPLFLDSVFDDLVGRPLTVYARAETIAALREHMFNGVIWPDFEALPSADQPVLRFQTIAPGDRIELEACSMRAVDVHHSVPSLGFCIEYGQRVFAFSGDTMTNEGLWPVLNAYPSLDVLVMEVSFPNNEQRLATDSGHHTPQTLAKELLKYKAPQDLATMLYHIKPPFQSEVELECAKLNGVNLQILQLDDQFVL